jgi:hypothetical protein
MTPSSVSSHTGKFDDAHVGRRLHDVERLLEVAGVGPGPIGAVRDLLMATTKAWTSTGPAAEGSRRQAAAAAAAGPMRAGAGLPRHADSDSESEEEEEEGEEEDAGAVLPEPSEHSVAASAAAYETGAVATAAGRARAASTSDIIIGMVGHPNVGKSSVINTICAAKRVSVSRTAGHTKRAQTIPVTPGLQLLDCPGLVFPRGLVPRPPAKAAGCASATASAAAGSVVSPVDPLSAEHLVTATVAAARGGGDEDAATPGSLIVLPRAMAAEERAAAATRVRGVFPSRMAASPAATGEAVERAMQQLCGVISLAQVREPYTAVRYLAERMPIEAMYGLRLPKDEDGWSPLLICEELATKRGLHNARTGRPDGHAAGREILYDTQVRVPTVYAWSMYYQRGATSPLFFVCRTALFLWAGCPPLTLTLLEAANRRLGPLYFGNQPLKVRTRDGNVEQGGLSRNSNRVASYNHSVRVGRKCIDKHRETGIPGAHPLELRLGLRAAQLELLHNVGNLFEPMHICKRLSGRAGDDEESCSL